MDSWLNYVTNHNQSQYLEEWVDSCVSGAGGIKTELESYTVFFLFLNKL